MDERFSFLMLLMTIWIWCVANNISDKQSEIMDQQSHIMESQVNLQQQFLDFEKHKFGSDVARVREMQMNELFDKVMWQDAEMTNVHSLLKDGYKVENARSLDKYVSEFEEIGGYYCNWSAQYSDVSRILKNILQSTCGSSQIYNHYQNTKSWLSGLCKSLFPQSTVMAKYANPDKCPIIKNKGN